MHSVTAALLYIAKIVPTCSKQNQVLLHARFLLGVFLDSEYGGDMFLRNVA
jgi:hypothetical protein